MTCAPQLPANATPATLDEAAATIATQRRQIDQARNILNAGGELPQLGYTEGGISISEDGLITVPLSTALATARLVMAPAVAERFAARLGSALARQRGCTCHTNNA